MIFLNKYKFFIIGLIIAVFAIIGAGYGISYFYSLKTDQLQPEVQEADKIVEIHGALAKIKLIDSVNRSIIVSILMPQQSSSFDENFKLIKVSKTSDQPATKDFQIFFSDDKIDLSSLNFQDVIFIETKENILNPPVSSLTPTLLQKLTISQ